MTTTFNKPTRSDNRVERERRDYSRLQKYWNGKANFFVFVVR